MSTNISFVNATDLFVWKCALENQLNQNCEDLVDFFIRTKLLLTIKIAIIF